MTSGDRGTFGRLGFVLAAAGSAIGLGNIVFFSSNAYKYGGGAFYVPYLVALFLIVQAVKATDDASTGVIPGLVLAVAWTLRANGARKAWLLLASYTFYAAWDWRFLFLIVLSTAVDYCAGLESAGIEIWPANWRPWWGQTPNRPCWPPVWPRPTCRRKWSMNSPNFRA